MSAVRHLADRIRPLRRIEYDRLVDAGLLANEKVELIRGLIVRMGPQGARHAAAVQKLNYLLLAAPGRSEQAVVRVQSPLALGGDSDPEPDLAVVPTGSYDDDHPTTAFLVIEVAESSLSEDRVVKGALYAENGIAEYWIVDTARKRVEVHSDVVAGADTRVTPHGRGETITSFAVPDVRVAVDEIFP